MSITPTSFLPELQQVIAEVAAQLTRRQAGVPGDGTVGELRLIQDELKALEARVSQGQLPPRGQRWLGATRIITDTWSFDSALGKQILHVADLYKRKLQP